MRIAHSTDPVYAPNSKGGAHANPERYPEEAVWETDGELVRAAYTLRPGDGDFNQANDLVNKVMDDAARDRLVNNIVGHVSDGVEEPVLSRVFEYWKNVDQTIGERVEQGVMANRRENGQ